MGDNQNNSMALIVLGVLGCLAIIITGKFILENSCDHENHSRPIIINRDKDGHGHGHGQPRPPQPPNPPQPPQVVIPYEPCPEYHNRSEFWLGYNDGWDRRVPRMTCPEYSRGYAIGEHDRIMNRRYYYENYYPPGFHIRLPGIRFDIR